MVTTSTDRIRPDFRKSPLLISLAVIYLIVFIWSAIDPLHPADWRLENVLSILFVTLLILTYKKFLSFPQLSPLQHAYDTYYQHD